MAIHVAILHRSYLRLILAGDKTVESRLTRTARPPYRQVAPGERLFLKASGGPFVATVLVSRAHFHDRLTPEALEQLQQRWEPRVCGGAAYWRQKRTSRFATFLELDAVEALEVGPAYTKAAYQAWHVLSDAASPLLDWPLTPGALRNHYVVARGPAGYFPAGDLELQLPSGERVVTQRVHGGRLRWRGWRPYFARCSLRPGDGVRFVRVAPGRYRVAFVRRGRALGPPDAQPC